MALKHQHAVRAGEMIFTCGQMDLNLKSNLQNHNDHRMQSLIAMAAIRALL
jgi:enamine deaminase RidA (YjgF/YER057c/UK114 family)|tara:strand:+ start:1635 stop:1787 length:153 start_codon:yes stop_codon:yes gene_type:complete